MSARAWLGAGFLVLTVATAATFVARTPGATTLARRVVDSLVGRTVEVRVVFEADPSLSEGDPVYTEEGEAFALAGRVRSIEGSGPWNVVLDLDPSLPRRIGPGTRVLAMTPDRDLAWVARVLVPPEARAALIEDLGRVWREQRSTVLPQLQATLTSMLERLVGVLGETFDEAVAANRSELDAFLVSFQRDIYPHELQPVVDQVWLPAVRERLSASAATLGAEIARRIKWTQAAGVVWAAALERIGVARDNAVKEALGKLIQESAVPVIEEQGPAMMAEALRALSETFAESRGSVVLESALRAVAEDPEFRALASGFLRSWILENEAFRAELVSVTEDEAFQGLRDALWDAAEPVLKRHLEDVLTTSDRQGMDHRLARVLRRVVLQKDERYALVLPVGPGPLDATQAVLRGVIGRDP